MVVKPKKILITGADGFVGRMLRSYWREHRVDFVGAVREIPANDPHANELVALGDFTRADWNPLLKQTAVIVHLAAHAHVMHERVLDPEIAYRHVNVKVTQRLARAAAAAGVRRFVHASSVKVIGESTLPGHAFDERAAAAPEDIYGLSKWAAEQILWRVAKERAFEVVVLRFPLVYGPGVKANFLALMRWIARERPLPFGAIDNQRSLLYVGNLVSAINAACMHSAAPGNTYFVADRGTISTPELCRRIANALGMRARLVRVPESLLRLLGALTGHGGEISRLTGSLVVDSSAIRKALDWSPPFSMQEGLMATARWYKRGP